MNSYEKAFQRNFPKHYPCMFTLARTGMRLGEALGLKWEDIDFQNRFINTQRSIVKGRIETPKSGKSRQVDMSLQLTETLKNLKKQCESLIEKREIFEWVFINKVGKQLMETIGEKEFLKKL